MSFSHKKIPKLRDFLEMLYTFYSAITSNSTSVDLPLPKSIVAL